LRNCVQPRCRTDPPSLKHRETRVLVFGIRCKTRGLSTVLGSVSTMTALRGMVPWVRISVCLYTARFTVEARGREEKHFSQWEALKSRRPRNLTLHPKFSVQVTTRRENDMESTFVLHGIKSAQFFSLLEF
jgi:hypothetical protein